MKICPYNITNFNGVPTADIKIKGVDACYRLYKLNKYDKSFLKKLYDSVNVKELMPNLHHSEHIVWDNVLKNATECSGSIYKDSFLLTFNNKPCGIMNFREAKEKNIYHLNYITTFPVEQNKKVPFAGQILLNKLFRRFINTHNTAIELFAIKKAPFNPISKYLKLGFKIIGEEDFFNQKMQISRENVKKTLSNQEEFITFIPIQNNKNINLKKYLDLNYKK